MQHEEMMTQLKRLFTESENDSIIKQHVDMLIFDYPVASNNWFKSSV